jgi:hypothetical protein
MIHDEDAVRARPELPKWHPFTPFRVTLMIVVWLFVLLAPLVALFF